MHGIDLDDGAVELAAFSLCLALCDALEPEAIRASIRLFPPLANNTIHHSCFFDAKDQSIIREPIGVVVGNPPFKSRIFHYSLRIRSYDVPSYLRPASGQATGVSLPSRGHEHGTRWRQFFRCANSTASFTTSNPPDSAATFSRPGDVVKSSISFPYAVYFKGAADTKVVVARCRSCFAKPESKAASRDVPPNRSC